MRVDSFRSVTLLDSLHTDFQNLLLGQELSNLMNFMFSDLTPFMMRNQQVQIGAWLEPYAIEYFNEKLRGRTLSDWLSEVGAFA